MNRLFIFLLVLVISNSFVMLEEETIVLIASIIWVDAAGGVIREALTSELEGKGDKIKETFDWYLESQKRLLGVIMSKHVIRKDVSKGVNGIYSVYKERTLGGVNLNYELKNVVLGSQEKINDTIERGLTLVNELSRRDMQVSIGYPKLSL